MLEELRCWLQNQPGGEGGKGRSAPVIRMWSGLVVTVERVEGRVIMRTEGDKWTKIASRK